MFVSRCKNSDVANLDEEIVAVHFEIVELQRSPFARTQVDVMEQLSVVLSHNPLHKAQMHIFIISAVQSCHPKCID